MAWKIPKKTGQAKHDHRRGQKNRCDRARREVDTIERNEDIAVLDFETDPFDKETKLVVRPFLAVLHSRQFETIVIWDENYNSLIDKVIAAITNLPRKFTIYAHNGGKFDYMFLVNKLRGAVLFKGRGIMSALIGEHELRDSFHIIPERLAGYKKDTFDYKMLYKGRRDKNRAKIISYCINDCVYLLDIVCAFVARFGRKLSIGQAAQAEVKKAGYNVSKFTDGFDNYIRRFYFGGRVECVGGIGHFVAAPGRPLRLYDVNSMYPDAMVKYEHPIGGPDDFNVRPGAPRVDTVFVHLRCDNYGALVSRTEDGGTTATIERGEFFTTIHEHNAALELGLIENIEYLTCVDCKKRTTFEKFVVPAYENRLGTKAELDRMKKAGMDENDQEFLNVKKDDMFWKFLVNNSYGKFAQNPRKFKETYFTDIIDGIPQRPENDPEKTWGQMPVYENFAEGYAIWEKPQQRLAFNNVSTAASITGGARATLLRALGTAINPIYCDTDSIICEDLPGQEIHKTKLGAWDIEDEYSEVIIAGKKLYACKLTNGKMKYRSKGVSVTEWADFHAFLEDQSRVYTMNGPTMTRTLKYGYMSREVRATGPRLPNARLLSKRKA